MIRFKPKGAWIPPWKMPSDPIKAVFWFMHWLLRVLVRFLWVLILAGVIYESILNGVVGGLVTLLVGLALWAGLGVLLFVVNVTTGISQTVSEIGRAQRDFHDFTVRSPFSNSYNDDLEGKVVEGTVTDLDEERRKRRRE
jgi:hypothetical protein